MFDHAFLAAVDTLRRSFDAAMLDGQTGDERLQSDLVGGDLTWEISYALPGEGLPPRVRADVTLEWPTWSQTAFRSWNLGDEIDEAPELGIEVLFRIQGLADLPDLQAMRDVLDPEGPDLGREHLRLASPMTEHAFDGDLNPVDWAVEFAYDGSYELTEPVMADRAQFEAVLGAFGPWVASMLVRLGDLQLTYLPQRDLGEA